ncbi:MAG: YaaA family protein [Pararhodobacter sp.]|nr:YaaA family protein [Pararhodobacter sp.]
MLVVISPAKRLNWLVPGPGGTRPRFQADAARLAAIVRRLSPGDLARLMRLSPALAARTHGFFRDWRDELALGATRPAALGFAGDTYTGLHYASFEPEMRDCASRHLRILSGLYGLLAPEDAILPHRLEMGAHLANPRGARLYDWWGARIARALAEDAAATGARALVNCASVEYFAVVERHRRVLGLPVINPRFEEERVGTPPRVEALHAKRARGAMARFIIEHRLTAPDDLRHFDAMGYRFQPDAGNDPLNPVFRRFWPG